MRSADAAAIRLWHLLHQRCGTHPAVAELAAAAHLGSVPTPQTRAAVTCLLADACRYDPQFQDEIYAAYRDATAHRESDGSTNSMDVGGSISTGGGHVIQATGNVTTTHKAITNYVSRNPATALAIVVLLLFNGVLVVFGGAWVTDKIATAIQETDWTGPSTVTTAASVAQPGGTLLATGVPLACGLREDRSARCWWEDDYLDGFAGVPEAPPDRFTGLSVFDSVACGLRENRTVLCWGVPRSWVDGEPREQPKSPSGTFTTIVVGCGIRDTGIIQCWGDHAPEDLPEGTFRALAYGSDNNACAVGTDGALSCWGRDNNPVVESPPAGAFTAVSVGHDHACALDADGEITCWGANGAGQADAPSGRHVAIATGAEHSCAHRADRTIVCWGRNDDGPLTPPDGEFAVLGSANGGAYSCGTRDEGTVECWGLDPGDAPPRDEVFARP